MHPRYFGDSYDIIKQCFLAWLAPFGPWQVHPMFSETVATEEAEWFGLFLNAQVLSSDPLHDRRSFVQLCATAGNLFLDPDIGLGLPRRRSDLPLYLLTEELVHIASARPSHLTLVYDQSFSRGRQRQGAAAKLDTLRQAGISGFYYLSHAPLLVVCGDADHSRLALFTVAEASRLPSERFLTAA